MSYTRIPEKYTPDTSQHRANSDVALIRCEALKDSTGFFVERTEFGSVEILNGVQCLERLKHAIHALSGRRITLVALQSLS